MISIPVYEFVIKKVVRTGGDEGSPNAVTEANILIKIDSINLWAETHYFGYQQPLLQLTDLDKFEGMHAKGKIEFQLHGSIKKSNEKQKTITQIGNINYYNFNGKVKEIICGTKKYETKGYENRIFHYGNLLIDFGIKLVFQTNEEEAKKFNSGDYVSLANASLVIRQFEQIKPPKQTGHES